MFGGVNGVIERDATGVERGRKIEIDAAALPDARDDAKFAESFIRLNDEILAKTFAFQRRRQRLYVFRRGGDFDRAMRRRDKDVGKRLGRLFGETAACKFWRHRRKNRPKGVEKFNPPACARGGKLGGQRRGGVEKRALRRVVSGGCALIGVGSCVVSRRVSEGLVRRRRVGIGRRLLERRLAKIRLIDVALREIAKFGLRQRRHIRKRAAAERKIIRRRKIVQRKARAAHGRAERRVKFLENDGGEAHVALSVSSQDLMRVAASSACELAISLS